MAGRQKGTTSFEGDVDVGAMGGGGVEGLGGVGMEGPKAPRRVMKYDLDSVFPDVVSPRT